LSYGLARCTRSVPGSAWGSEKTAGRLQGGGRLGSRFVGSVDDVRAMKPVRRPAGRLIADCPVPKKPAHSSASRSPAGAVLFGTVRFEKIVSFPSPSSVQRGGRYRASPRDIRCTWLQQADGQNQVGKQIPKKRRIEYPSTSHRHSAIAARARTIRTTDLRIVGICAGSLRLSSKGFRRRRPYKLAPQCGRSISRLTPARRPESGFSTCRGPSQSSRLKAFGIVRQYRRGFSA